MRYERGSGGCRLGTGPARGRRDGKRSGPSRKNFVRLRDLFRRTGEIAFVFSGPAGDMDLDGFQAAVLHPQAELFIDFLDAVLLQAIAHASVSVRDGLMAMLNAGYFGRHQTFKQRLKRLPKSVRCAGETVSHGFCGRRDRRGRMVNVFLWPRTWRLRPLFSSGWRCRFEPVSGWIFSGSLSGIYRP